MTLSGSRPVVAQNTTTTAAAAQGTPLEQEALRLYNENKLLTARTKAEQALRADPDSLIGNYVMGCVLREAEGSLARAMYHLGHAREVYELRYGTARPPGAPWQLHREILFAIQSLAGEMEEYDYQLNVLEFYDYLYDPDLLAEHAWPLLHLGRYNEARDFARRAIAVNDAWQQSLGRNGLCAVEGAARQRQAQYQACLDAFQNAQRRAQGNTDLNPATAPHVAVHAYNAALGAWSVLRHDEVHLAASELSRHPVVEDNVGDLEKYRTHLPLHSLKAAAASEPAGARSPGSPACRRASSFVACSTIGTARRAAGLPTPRTSSSDRR
jgi:tetratricopeptide (TPR) repeat protein